MQWHFLDTEINSEQQALLAIVEALRAIAESLEEMNRIARSTRISPNLADRGPG